MSKFGDSEAEEDSLDESLSDKSDDDGDEGEEGEEEQADEDDDNDIINDEDEESAGDEDEAHHGHHHRGKRRKGTINKLKYRKRILQLTIQGTFLAYSKLFFMCFSRRG